MVMNEMRWEIDHRLLEESVTIHRQSARSGNSVIPREGASGTWVGAIIKRLPVNQEHVEEDKDSRELASIG